MALPLWLAQQSFSCLLDSVMQTQQVKVAWEVLRMHYLSLKGTLVCTSLISYNNHLNLLYKYPLAFSFSQKCGVLSGWGLAGYNLGYIYFFYSMWRLVSLCFLATLASSLARPRLPPLSHEMVNYINKANTTWKVRAYLVTIKIIQAFQQLRKHK